MDNTIGQTIARARASRHMTQRELAAKAGLSRSYICDIENDRYMPSVRTLLLLAKILHVDLNFFALNDGNTSERVG